MAINNELIKMSCMFKVEDEKRIEETIKYLIEEDVKKEVEAKINQAIKEEWEDTIDVNPNFKYYKIPNKSRILELNKY